MRRALAILLLVAGVLLSAAAPAGASPYSDAVSASAPFGWWRLGELAGPVAAPASGLASGTWSGSVQFGAPGALDGDADSAASLTGSGYLALGTGFAPASAFTLEAWVKPATRSGTRYVLSKGSSSTGFHLYTSSGFPALKISTSITTSTLFAPASLATGTWHHLAGTFSAGVATLYVDGVIVATRTLSGTLRLSGATMLAGRYASGSSGYWSGALDEPAAYDRALSATEVADHAAAGMAPTPATVAIAGPPARTDDRHAGFALTGTDPQGAFTCALDGGGAAACGAATAWDALPDGAHTLVVTPADRWGRAGTPSSFTWIVDQTVAPDWDPAPPDSAIAASVGASTARTDVSFTLSSSKSRSTFTCSLDGGAYVGCGSTPSYSGLAIGGHVLRVRATDRFGHVEPDPSAFAWTIDHTPPDTALLAVASVPGAAGGVAAFASTEDGRFECRVDAGAWAPCAAPFAVPSGAGSVSVRAIDAAGNTDPSPATARFAAVGDGEAVEPTGAGSFASTSASIVFGLSGGASAVECRLDGGAWTACAPPVGLAGLAWGDHSWQLRATFGNGLHVASPELRWTATAPAARVAALQFPVLLHRSRDGRARSRGRVPTLRFALNVGVPVSLRVERVRGARASALGAWTVAGKAGGHVVKLPDKVLKRLRRGRYRILAQPAGGLVARVSFAVV